MRSMNRIAVGLWQFIYRPVFKRAARRSLKGRLLDVKQPRRGRWLEPDIRGYLNETWARTQALLPLAGMDELPTYGNRHAVFLAVVTTAAYQVMLERDVPSNYARVLVADIGWKIYSWMLQFVSFPFRLLIRDPGERMKRVLRTLMVFPFSAPGRPGYEVETWTEGNDTHTHWRHCPPQTFVRSLIQQCGDRGELDAFYASWCLYDWPGADILAGDDRKGHYSRPHTLSRGDSVCDMLWHGRARPVGPGRGDREGSKAGQKVQL